MGSSVQPDVNANVRICESSLPRSNGPASISAAVLIDIRPALLVKLAMNNIPNRGHPNWSRVVRSTLPTTFGRLTLDISKLRRLSPLVRPTVEISLIVLIIWQLSLDSNLVVTL